MIMSLIIFMQLPLKAVIKYAKGMLQYLKDNEG